MAGKIARILLVLSFLLSTFEGAPKVWAQQTVGEKSDLTGTRKQLATIIFAGLAGALLGLSTLSFYGRPQEHLSNLAMGFAFGVIGGTIFTTYKAAANPYDAYDIGPPPPGANLVPQRFESYAQQTLTPRMGWRWEF